MSKLVKYESVPALYEEREVARPATAVAVADALTAIPRDRRIVVPPLVTSHTRLTNAAVAMRHLALSTAQASLIDRAELSCLKLSYDGKETLRVEGANRAEHGVVSFKAKTRTPSPSWSVLVPAEAARAVLAALPNQPLELAPGDRLHVGHLSIQIVEGVFPAPPTVPADVEGGELKSIAFQAIISRVGLESATRFCSVVINPTGQANHQHLVFSPEKKQVAASDGKRARFVGLDVRSRARLEHPDVFGMTVASARAAVVLEESEFVLVSLETSGDLVVGGGQGYAIVTERRVQSGIPAAIFQILSTEGGSTFTVNRKLVLEFCHRAVDLFGEDEDPYISVFFGETFIRATATVRGEDVEREDIDWEIPLLSTRQTEFKDRIVYFDVRAVQEAVAGADGERVTFLLQRRASRIDPVAVYGEDTTKLSVISPIIGDQNDRYED